MISMQIGMKFFVVLTNVGQVSQIRLGITRVSLRHLNLIPLGYHHEWYLDWKLNYQFSLVWKLDVKTGFKKKQKKIEN